MEFKSEKYVLGKQILNLSRSYYNPKKALRLVF